MDRRLARGAGVCVLLAAAAAALWVRAEHRRADEPARHFAFTYAATVADVPSDAAQVRIWIPLAKTRDNQRILSRRIRASHPYQVHDEPTYGNDLLFLALSSPLPPAVEVSVEYEVEVFRESRLEADRAFAPMPAASADELAIALRNEPLMVVDQTVTQLAQEVTVGRQHEMDKARAIYDHVLRSMRYDKTEPGWGRGDTLRACRLGAGNCTDFHSLFISMARAVGIPARFVMGAPVPETPGGEIPGYHCWAEFYHPARGWVPVDASEAWRHPERRDYYFGTRDPNRILFSAGRNLQLIPAQQGGPVNFLVYPYVEVDGQPFGGRIETRLEFRDHQRREEA